MKKEKCEHTSRYVENGRVWCQSHCGWSETITKEKECKYCKAEKDGKALIMPYNKSEAKRYAKHLKHKFN